jgi:hypothetical protein
MILTKRRPIQFAPYGGEAARFSSGFLDLGFSVFEPYLRRARHQRLQLGV